MNTSGKRQIFNVECRACGTVWSPSFRSPLWWRAKKWDESGHLDALCVSGEDCGCQKKAVQPNAPYRVSGFDDDGKEFDRPFKSFTEAVAAYLTEARGLSTVFIEGVSPEVEQRLAMM